MLRKVGHIGAAIAHMPRALPAVRTRGCISWVDSAAVRRLNGGLQGFALTVTAVYRKVRNPTRLTETSMLIRSLCLLTVLGGLFAMVFTGCGHGPIVLSPSLGPVDASRPMVRYQPIQGTSCASMLDAIWDMKRLVGVDGYVEVTVQKEKCWTATAYPFTYGVNKKSLSVRPRSAASSGMMAPAEAPPQAAPVRREVARPAPAPARRAVERRAPEPAPAPRVTLDQATCEPVCRAFGKHAGTTALIQRVVSDRCVSRCAGGDSAYYDCVSRARGVKDVKRCNAK